MAKSDRVAEVAGLLLSLGWVPAGETRTETVRMPTQASPLLGGTGGELATFGGRARFALPGTRRRATVGRITTCFYVVADNGPTDFRNFPSRDIGAIETAGRA